MNQGHIIRQKFLNFFESKGHTIVPSSSLIPANDPTLMFTAAGMVQFKNVFTGIEERPYSRATSCQRCVRAGGKHNDLENVGHTARHHTFFEMLGNFSFGDYFKEDAIPFAWEFLTSEKWLGIPANKLYVTVYHTDDEAYAIWKDKVGIDEERIIRISTSDNFWSAGDTGPCGPCTEIFYDHGSQYWGGLPGTPEEDGDRYIEIWNIVFMQYDRQDDGELKDLPRKGVDTGAGLERLTAVMQHVNSNYDTDLIQSIIQPASKLSGISYIAHSQTASEEEQQQSDSLRVIADHLRSMSFLIMDGILPSNEGAGYVLRRIMRRAIRHASLLGINEAFLYRLVSFLSDSMGEHYKELKQAESIIVDTIKSEEIRFSKTLNNGLKLLNDEVAKLTDGQVFSGDTAFKLYDTYGFPVDLTQDVLLSKNIQIDMQQFNDCMEEQRRKAREAGLGGASQKKLAPIWYQLKDQYSHTEFVGYNHDACNAEVLAIIDSDNSIEQADAGQEVIIVTNKTPFYAQSGGQIGDTGSIYNDTCQIKVKSTVKVVDDKIFQHIAIIESGQISLGDSVTMSIASQKRELIRNNHTATHILHSALRSVLGDHVFQKGSEVSDARIRFDFTNNNALDEKQLDNIEKEVNQVILSNYEVHTYNMNKDEAVEKGAMALFGEKYDNDVRVVSIGDIEQKSESIELCGGTHTKRTGNIGLFKIVSEGGISAGIRRIEALTGFQAFEYLNEKDKLLKSIADKLSSPITQVSKRVEALQQEVKNLKLEVKKAKSGNNSQLNPNNIAEKSESINGITFIGYSLEGVEPKDLRELALEVKSKLNSAIILLASNNGEKSAFAACLTKDLTEKYKAGALVNLAAKTLGGKGGGRPDVAMAGANAGDLQAAINEVKQFIEA